MAERTAEGGVRLSLVLDQNGKPFVNSVQSAMAGATSAVTRAGGQAGRSFGDLLTSGFLVRAAAATVVLRRLNASAGEGSPQFRQLKKDVSEVSSELGTTLQGALAGVLSTAKPFLDWLQNASGATKGFVLGVVGVTTALGPMKAALLSLGIAGPQVTAVLVALGTALAALAGKTAEKREQVERNFSELVQSILNSGQEAAQQSREQLAAELDQEKQLLADRQKRLAELAQKQKSPQIDVTGAAVENDVRARLALQQEQNNLNASIAQSQSNISKLTLTVNAYDEALAVLSRGTVRISPEQMAVGEFVQALNIEIAAGEKTLNAARDQVNARRAELEEDLRIFENTEQLVDTADKRSREAFLRRTGGDEAEATKLQAKATAEVKTQKELQAQVSRELLSLDAAQLDLTKRIGDQSERTRTTELNRKILQAQLVDGLRGLGPVLEQQVLMEERRRLAIDEGGRAQTRILELDNQILAQSVQIADVERQRAELAKQQSEAKWREEVQAFQNAYLQNVQVEIALAKLAAESDQQFRRGRINGLSEELGLRRLSVQALQDELAVINAEAAIAPELAAERRTKLLELIGLLEQEKNAQQGISQELQIVEGGFRRLADQGSLAIVQLFTRGKAEAKDFAEFALQTFEQVLQALLARAITLGILSLFTGGLAGAAGGGGGFLPSLLDFGSAGAASMPRMPNLPQLPSGSLMTSSAIGRLESKLDQLSGAVSNLKLLVGEFRLKGADLRASYQIADAKTAKLKTS